MRSGLHRFGNSHTVRVPSTAGIAASLLLLGACGAGPGEDPPGATREPAVGSASPAEATSGSAAPAAATSGSASSAEATAEPASSPVTTPPTPPPVDPADVASIDAIIAAVYDVISGPAGAARDWDRMRSLFTPGARLIPIVVPETGPARTAALSVEDYIERVGPQLVEDGFFEREIASRTERYGYLAHVFSTYESRRLPEDAEPFARGINSFQLLHDGGRWWIVTIYWNSERPDQPIPAEYLSGA